MQRLRRFVKQALAKSYQRNMETHEICENITAADNTVLMRRQGDEVVQNSRSRLLQFGGLVERVIKSPCVMIPSKVLHPILIICRFVSLIVFSTYDTKCVILERASVSNCHQDIYVPGPEIWTVVWMALSVLSSINFIAIVVDNMESRLLNFQRQKTKKLFRKGSFISLLLLLVLTTIYYIFRAVVAASTIGMAIAIIMSFWPSTMVLVAIFLNYTPRVRWIPKDCCSASCCFPRVFRPFMKYSLFLFYWTALAMYFLEATGMWIAVTLDAAHQVVPLIDRKFPDETTRYKAIVVVLLGFTVGFHSQILSFFWQKMFHGDRNFFSEPCSKLIDDQTEEENTEAAATTSTAIAEGQPATKPVDLNKPSTCNQANTKCITSSSQNESTAFISTHGDEEKSSQAFNLALELEKEELLSISS